MKLYVAGPMSQREFYNVEQFDRIANQWRDKGHEVTTPFDTNTEVWQRHHGRAFDPYTDKCDYGDPLLAEMFIEDVKAILASEGLILLLGWSQSKGALREVAVAQLFGKRFFLASSGAEVDVSVELDAYAVQKPPAKAYGYNPTGALREESPL